MSGPAGGGGQVKSQSSWGGVRSSWGGVRSKVNPNPARGVRSSRGVCQVQLAGGGVWSSRGGSGQKSIQLGGGQVQPGGGSGQRSIPIQPGGVRSSQGVCQVQLAEGGGQVQAGGGSASCALLRAVCLLRSRRRTFLCKY